MEKKKRYKCKKCKDTGYIEYYHDAGDHFSAGPSPFSEYRTKPCDCKDKEK
jgi:hypothetical protein